MKTTLIIMALFFSNLTFAQDKTGLDALNYPELEVVPRASDRLEQEYRGEGGFKAYWPWYVAGLGAIWAGTSHRAKEGPASNNFELTDADKKTSTLTANTVTLIGAGWIGLGAYLGSRRYYAYALAEARNIKGTDKRSQLQKERLSEEAMENAATLHKKVTYLLTGLQIVATGYMIDTWSHPDTRNNGYISMLMALVPLMFQHDYIYHYNKHLEYKQKIYAPLVGAAPMFNEKSEYEGTTLSFVWEF
jgi:hypothetical protein